MFLHTDMPLFQHHLLKNLSFLHLIIWTTLLKINCHILWVVHSFLLLYGIPMYENTLQFILLGYLQFVAILINVVNIHVPVSCCECHQLKSYTKTSVFLSNYIENNPHCMIFPIFQSI